MCVCFPSVDLANGKRNLFNLQHFKFHLFIGSAFSNKLILKNWKLTVPNRHKLGSYTIHADLWQIVRVLISLHHFCTFFLCWSRNFLSCNGTGSSTESTHLTWLMDSKLILCVNLFHSYCLSYFGILEMIIENFLFSFSFQIAICLGESVGRGLVSDVNTIVWNSNLV